MIQLQRILTTFGFLLAFFQLMSQSTGEFPSDPLPIHYSELILSENLKHHVHALAADSMQGRDTGEPGGIMAGNYIENHFIELGIPPVGDTTFRQTISFTWLRWDENDLWVNETAKRHFWDYLVLPRDNNSMEDIQVKKVVFVGYGIDDEKYQDLPYGEFRGKVALVMAGEPKDENGNYLLTGTEEPSDWSTSIQLKLEAAAQRGFDCVLFVEPELRQIVNKNRRILFRPVVTGDRTEPDEGIPNSIHLSMSTAEELLKDSAEELFESIQDENQLNVSKWVGEELEVNLELNLLKNYHTLEDDNILGYIQGIDPDKKEELIILSAHYDHIGFSGDEIFAGANDNASGTSAVMEIGRAFSAAKKAGDGPERSVLLLLLTGEEKGLLGSAYYAENPIFPLENTVANVNIDMLGRADEKHRELGVENYIYPIGSNRLSTELHKILLEVNEQYSDIKLDFTYNDPEDPNRYYFRSDHYNFARKGIPAVFYFNGMNEDYHLASDTPDKLNFESMTAVTRHIFHLAWELANREERIEADLWEE
nr:M28 family peptidase [Saprospiraceae bacterium]